LTREFSPQSFPHEQAEPIWDWEIWIWDLICRTIFKKKKINFR
jgi:hypothetical protein